MKEFVKEASQFGYGIVQASIAYDSAQRRGLDDFNEFDSHSHDEEESDLLSLGRLIDEQYSTDACSLEWRKGKVLPDCVYGQVFTNELDAVEVLRTSDNQFYVFVPEFGDTLIISTQ